MTHPLTQLVGLPHEKFRGIEPGSTLTGGSSGTAPILAEKVEELVYVPLLARISDLEDRVDALESDMAAARWRHIAEGSQSGGSTVNLVIPSGYKALRLQLVGDVAAGPNDILLRVNGDTGSNHLWGLWIRAADGTTTDATYGGAGTSAWHLARWSTTESNNAFVEISFADGLMNPSYTSEGTRVSAAGAVGHQNQHGFGKYLGDVVISSLDVIADSTTFATVQWVLEGYLSS